MQQSNINYCSTSKQQIVSVEQENKETLAKKWLAENQEAIAAYKAEQQEKGQTFSQMVGQI